MLIGTLSLLAIAWRWFGLGGNNGALQTFTFQTLLFFAIASVISVRERRTFWSSWPSTVLATALFADAAIGVISGLTGLAELRPLPFSKTTTILAFAAVFPLALNDTVKVTLMSRLAQGKTT